MSFLLDTDICSAHLRGRTDLTHRLIQHSGRLFLSSIALAELYVWVFRNNTEKRRTALELLLNDLIVLPFDERCALTLGKVRAALLNNGKPVSANDLLIATVALTFDLTLVTHNTKDYEPIPDLKLEDWLVS